MMQSFTYEGPPIRVIFGKGAFAQVAEEARLLGARKVMVLSAPHQTLLANEAVRHLGDLAAGVFSEATVGAPVEVTERAIAHLKGLSADMTLAVGGGSTTELSKAIAIRQGTRQMVVPITYAGSEMTTVLQETDHGTKRTRCAREVLPRTVIYDVALTMGVPAALSAKSGMNALAYAVEALCATESSPLVGLMAQEAVRTFAEALPRIVEQPGDVEARTRALYACWLAGMCRATGGKTMHDALCCRLEMSFDLPHAETQIIMLPYTTLHAAPDVTGPLADVLGSAHAAAGIYDLAGRLGVPRALKDIGLSTNDLERASDLAAQDAPGVARDQIRDILENALEGRPPHSSSTKC